jgi:prepilin-type processing-associated H-X9-DG protein
MQPDEVQKPRDLVEYLALNRTDLTTNLREVKKGANLCFGDGHDKTLCPQLLPLGQVSSLCSNSVSLNALRPMQSVRDIL